MMGFEEPGRLVGMHQVKSERNGQYDEYEGEYDHGMASGFANGFSSDMQGFDNGHQQHFNNQLETNLFGSETSNNQLYMDAERMAQLEREFHEQVIRLTNARPELEVMLNGQSDTESITNSGSDKNSSGIVFLPVENAYNSSSSSYSENHQIQLNQSSQDPSASSDSSKPFPCPICGKKFGRVSHVRRHQLLHTGDKPFQCEVCHERFTRMENRDRHMVTHTKNRPFNCSVCQKGFTQLNRLRVHMLIHTGDRPYVCSICEKTFMRMDHLKVHLKMHEKHAEEGHGPKWNRKIRKCSIDQQPHTTPTRTQEIIAIKAEPVDPDTLLLEHHQVTYSNQQEIPPNYAESQNKLSEIFQPQQRNHRGIYPPNPMIEPNYLEGQDKPYHCPQCPKTFARRDHFNRHVLVHSGAKPHECEVCGRSFSRKDNKYSHMANCILKNFGISIEQDQRGTLESAVEAKMLEISGLIQPRHKFDFESKQESSTASLTEEEIAKLNQPTVEMFPLEVDASLSDDADEQSIHSTGSVGTLRLGALDELAKGQEPLDESEVSKQEDDEYDEDEEDFVDPSDFLSAHLNDLSEAVEPSESALPTGDQTGRNYQCGVCQRTFAHKSHLVRHSMMHTGEKPFKCDQCDKSFNRKEHLQRHVIMHTGIKPYKCNVCDRSFYHLHQQIRHTTEEHGEDALAATKIEESGSFMDSGDPVLAADGTYHCDRCDKSYAIKFHLKRHYVQHTGEKPFQCELCDQRFTRSEYKRRHMAIHTNDRRYECEFCERRFMRADHMLAHIKTHEGILPYKCNVCGQRFGTSKEKLEHSRKHTGAYRCEMCLERFELFSDLAEHRRDIHLQNDTEKSEILVGRHEHYPCPICKKYFSIVALGDHLKTHVSDEAAESGRATNSSERNDGDSVGSSSFGCQGEDGNESTIMGQTLVKEEMIDCSEEYIQSY